MSFHKSAGKLNFHLSTTLKIYNQFVSSCSTKKKTRTELSIQINERGRRIVSHAANKLRFGALKLLIKAIVIVKNVCKSDVCRTGVKYIIRKIVHK